MTRDVLIDRVWGPNYYGDTKTLDVHVKRLRAKVEDDPGHPGRDRDRPRRRLPLREGVAQREVNRVATCGTMYGMSQKTTIYLPDDLKAAVEREARRQGLSEAEVIRRAVAGAVHRPAPRAGIIDGEPIAGRDEELLTGFGER